MYIQSYKELIVWQKSIDLVGEVYILTGKFPKEETYGLVSQERRAAVSIPSNIAEGQRRKDLPEFLQFLRMADASSAELETQLIISKKLYPNLDYSRADSLLEEVQKMLNVMMGKLELKANSSKALPAGRQVKANGGQMLVEAMIAITIAITGLLGIFSLLSNSLSLNRVVGDQVVATNLASEGVELVKNLIDSNIIQRKPWNLGVDPGEFEIDFSGNSLSPYQNRYFNFNSATGEYGYGSGQPVKFSRKIVIGQPSPDEIKTNSIVKWETRGGGKFEINLEDHFFNWR